MTLIQALDDFKKFFALSPNSISFKPSAKSLAVLLLRFVALQKGLQNNLRNLNKARFQTSLIFKIEKKFWQIEIIAIKECALISSLVFFYLFLKIFISSKNLPI